MTSVVLAQMAQDQFPCWARAATGVVLAVIAWAAFVGGRTAFRQYRDGRATAANVTGVVVVVGVIAAIALFWLALQLAF